MSDRLTRYGEKSGERDMSKPSARDYVAPFGR